MPYFKRQIKFGRTRDPWITVVSSIIAFCIPPSLWSALVYKAYYAIPMGEWQELLQIVVLIIGFFMGLSTLWVGFLLAAFVFTLLD